MGADLQTFRNEKDDFFRGPDSPLTPEQQTSFSGLHHYPEDPALRLRLPLDENVPPDPIMMLSTGLRLRGSDSRSGQRRYVRAGKILFAVQDQPAKPSVFKDEHGYFLPFRDATGEDETYPAGRYLEPATGADGLLEVDFNLAYNPYCAYNQHYSCPIPPRDNVLTVRIEAGEKRFVT